MGGMKWGLVPTEEQPSVKRTVLARCIMSEDVSRVAAECKRTTAGLYYSLDVDGMCIGRALSHVFSVNVKLGHDMLGVLVESGMMWPILSERHQARRAMAIFLLAAPMELVCQLIARYVNRLPRGLATLFVEARESWRGLDART